MRKLSRMSLASLLSRIVQEPYEVASVKAKAVARCCNGIISYPSTVCDTTISPALRKRATAVDFTLHVDRKAGTSEGAGFPSVVEW
ncbi:unnamed protein product [Ixodes pacificus]